MNLKVLNKFLRLQVKEQSPELVCQLVNGNLRCKLANIDNLEQKISFNLTETLDFFNEINSKNLNESRSIRLKLANNYYRLTIKVKSEKEININICKNKPESRSLSHLGFKREQIKDIKNSLNLKKGLIIITGSQSSGKTTTYYSFLNHINKEQKLIYSLEKYPSLQLKDINQIKVDNNNTLDKIKSSDAEIIGFDQIENKDELESLFYLANSGRLVIACLDQEKAVEALHFITNSNLPFNLIADNLKTIVAQKLLKKNCPKCLTKINVNKNWLKVISKASDNTAKNTWFNSSGCNYCSFSGKDKLLPCFEMMNISNKGSLKPGFKPLIYDAVEKANNGLFSPEEISQLLK
jgi:type II secretory ATPase GspE/PulE/Tfp pilus assembly ATPase PilB-like protein